MATYACSDFHGFYSLYTAAKALLKPEDKVIFMGDAIDRGPFGWKLLKTILDDPQWVYVMGNHEDMLLKVYKADHDPKGMFEIDAYKQRAQYHRNGGDVTLEAMRQDSEEIIQHYITKLLQTPYDYYYTSPVGKIYLSHSGFCSTLDWEPARQDKIWDRHHFLRHIPKGFEADLVIHGHTPIPALFEWLFRSGRYPDWEWGTPYFYADGQKCDIDCYSIVTGTATLLCLDDLTSHILKIDDSEKQYLWLPD